MRRRTLITTILFCIITSGMAMRSASADEPDNAPAFREALANKAAELARTNITVILGREGFYFLTRELRHYSVGPFWGDDAIKTSVAQKNQDPHVAILDFQAQCKKAGVQLIVLPVPGKTAIYPDKIGLSLEPGRNWNIAHQTFYDLLREEGVEVIDLTPAMLTLRKTGSDAHCHQDTHFSPAAVKLAARQLADSIRQQPWCKEIPRKTVKRTTTTLEATGDLVAMFLAASPGDPDVAKEKLKIEQITLDGQKVESDDKSPVVLMGDSHTIVYHDPISGGINASGAGLMDHLAAELGFAPDMIGVLGSGANASRITLARRRDNLAGKKVIIWCFAAREFTEAEQGWMKVPVVK